MYLVCGWHSSEPETHTMAHQFYGRFHVGRTSLETWLHPLAGHKTQPAHYELAAKSKSNPLNSGT